MRKRIRRDWSDANEKREACRVCGTHSGVEMAHLSARAYDPPSDKPGFDRYVRPESVIPLCGPATDTTTCHGKQHDRELDLIPHTTKEEQASVVLDMGLQRAYEWLAAE